MHHKTREQGQVLILVVVGIVALLGITALAVDGGNAYLDRRKAHNAADSAALAAIVRKIQDGSCTNCVSVARSRALSNGYNSDGTSNTVTVNNPPSTGCNGTTPTFSDDPNQYVQVVITTKVTTYFAPVVGVNQTQNCVEAIAKANASPVTGDALVALNHSAHCAISATGNAGITIQNAGIVDNSLAGSDAICSTGNASIQAATTIAVCGGTKITGNASITPNPVPCGSQITDPFASLHAPTYPGLPCPSKSAVAHDNLTLNPGCYSGISATANSTIVLNPGIYYLDSGNFSAGSNATISGTNVLIYMKTGSVSFTGNSVFTITAPVTGDYKGLAFYLDRSNASPVSVTGNGGSALTGTIYAIASKITVTGNGVNNTIDSQMIGDTIEVNGNGEIKMTYDQSKQYAAPSIQFSQ